MSGQARLLFSKYRGRDYGGLILDLRARLDEAHLAEETLLLIGELRPQVRDLAEAVYETFLQTPAMTTDFFDSDAGDRINEIARTVKQHYVKQHSMLLKEAEAVALAQIVTLNFSRLAHMNEAFDAFLTHSRRKRFFERLFR